METNTAITFLPLVPVRAFPSEKAEMVTQMLFGELCHIIDERSQWVRIELDNDGYSGWVDSKMLNPVIDETLSTLTGYGKDIVTTPVAEVRNILTNKTYYLPAGSILPHCDRAHGTFAVQSSVFAINPSSIGPVTGRVALTAAKFIGAPYLWGGKTVFGMDCSGLIQTVFALHGIRLPRDASQQASCGEETTFAKRLSGDLAFFANDEGKITHVGMVVDGGAIIHASGSVRVDKLDAKGIFNETKQIHTHRLHSIRTIRA